jgi:hypothetical protein
MSVCFVSVTPLACHVPPQSIHPSIPHHEAPQMCCGVEGVAFISGGLPPATSAVEELCMCT